MAIDPEYSLEGPMLKLKLQYFGHLMHTDAHFIFLCISSIGWTIRKAESQRTDAFKLVLEKTPASPLDSKEIKPVNLKGNQP